jgi:hypothetical protein
LAPAAVAAQLSLFGVTEESIVATLVACVLMVAATIGDDLAKIRISFDPGTTVIARRKLTGCTVRRHGVAARDDGAVVRCDCCRRDMAVRLIAERNGDVRRCGRTSHYESYGEKSDHDSLLVECSIDEPLRPDGPPSYPRLRKR